MNNFVHHQRYIKKQQTGKQKNKLIKYTKKVNNFTYRCELNLSQLNQAIKSRTMVEGNTICRKIYFQFLCTFSQLNTGQFKTEKYFWLENIYIYIY